MSTKIRLLNDKFRKTFVGGIVQLSPTIDLLSWQEQEYICDLVQTYCLFDEVEDPDHKEGSFVHNNCTYTFAITYHDRYMSGDIPDPENPRTTLRVLTIHQTT